MRIAREAGDLTLDYFRRRDLVVEFKADASPVTAADRAAEELLRQRIAERVPGRQHPRRGVRRVGRHVGLPMGARPDRRHEIVHPRRAALHDAGGGARRGAAEARRDLRAGLRRNGVRGQRRRLLVQRRPTATTRHPRRRAFPACGSCASRCCSPARSLASAPGGRKTRLAVYLELQRAARLARTWGDGYGYLMVATGRAEVMIDPVMNLWDAAPLQTIIEEAGGQFTDWQGQPTVHAGEAIATNGLVTDEVLAITRGH